MLNLRSLNPQQRQAVETTEGPVLILAGAGTGKTRAITCRIAHLIEKGVAPGNILAVTFTNKAAREMKERVARMVPRAARRSSDGPTDTLTIATFHSFGARLLRQHIELLGYKRNFVIYNEAEQLGAIKKILSRISAQGEDLDPQRILSSLSRLKNNAATGGNLSDSTLAMADHVRPRYETALRACNAVDFDDLLGLTFRLLEKHPGVLAECRAKYRYVMVDEFQDTNAVQFQLVQLLALKHRNLCVVGDDDQSIYGWRGAQIANLLDMEKHFPEVRIIKLEQNYRSTNTILRAANAVIKNNVRRRVKQLWSQNGPGTKITLHTFPDDETEARVIVEEIEYLRQLKRVPWTQQAILFRTNQQSRPLETALRKQEVRYHLIGGQSYFDRREVKDLLAYLKVFVNPHDDVSLLRIANVPARGLSETTMERLLGASQECHGSVFAAMNQAAAQALLPPKARENVRAFAQLITTSRQRLQSQPPLRLANWIDGFLNEIGYFEELRRSEKEAEAAENRVRNLKDLVATLDGGPAGTRPALERLEEFLEELALDNDRDKEEEARGDAVTLITMHSCKGLEFPHVFIVGLEDGLLPHTRSKEEGTLDEERRLFYVAMTRAMQTLSISYCLGRKKFGKLTPSHPSPFLKELPLDLWEHADERVKQPVAVETGKSLFADMRARLGE